MKEKLNYRILNYKVKLSQYRCLKYKKGFYSYFLNTRLQKSIRSDFILYFLKNQIQSIIDLRYTFAFFVSQKRVEK